MNSKSHFLKLQQDLKDARSRRVIFVAHCILNENTRYLGGAGTNGMIGSIIQELQARGLGIVQMVCPEQLIWGGVLKKWLLLAYSLKTKHPLLYRLRGVFIPLFQWYTQIRFLTIAKNIIHQIQNYVESGFEVKGIIGIDGSPSCGVMKNLHLRKSFDYLANLHPENYDRDMINQEMYAKCLLEGPGFFINTLQSQLKKKKLTIPFYAHNLQKELSGNLTSSIIPK